MLWSKKSKSEKPAKVVKAAAPAKAVKTAEAKPAKKAVAVATVSAPVGNFGSSASAILRPHVTEKSGLLSQSGVYTFQVSREANSEAISKAITALYKVKPVKVAIINLPAKSVFVRGRHGTVSGIRKALVTVKKGDKIDFI